MGHQLHKVPEFAAALNMHPKTVWAWIGQGKVGVVRLGRAVRIKQEEIDRLIEEGTTSATR